jgi:glucokinase
MVQEHTCAIGVDLGGTKAEVALVGSTGLLLSSTRMTTRVVAGPAGIEFDIATTIKKLTDESSFVPVGVGIGVAGQIERLSGVVDFSPNLGWRRVPLRADIEGITKIPTVVTNDVRAITLGEWIFGAGRGCSDIVCLFVGTGVGGGIVSGGHMLEGCTNTAGEIGHIVIDANGPACTCGNRGCLEAFAGGWAIAERARDAVRKNPSDGAMLLRLVHDDIDAISARTVAEAKRQGDTLASAVMDAARDALVAGGVSMVNAFNPERVVLGGGIIEGMPEWVEQIRNGILRRSLPAATRDLCVVKGDMGSKAGVIGAATLALRAFTEGCRPFRKIE